MFAVRLDHELASGFDTGEKKVGEILLEFGVKVQLWLFEDDQRARPSEEAEDTTGSTWLTPTPTDVRSTGRPRAERRDVKADAEAAGSSDVASSARPNHCSQLFRAS